MVTTILVWFGIAWGVCALAVIGLSITLED